MTDATTLDDLDEDFDKFYNKLSRFGPTGYQATDKKRKSRAKLIAVADLETDPFNGTGLLPVPFAWGLMYATDVQSAPVYETAWHDDPDACKRTLIDALMRIRETHVVYFHNAGGYDQPLLAEWCAGKSVLRDGRLISGWLSDGTTRVETRDGKKVTVRNKIEVRDSMALLPCGLAKLGAKLEIDYAKMLPAVRAKHRPEIETYLRADCQALYEALLKTREMVGGSHLTIAGAAKTLLKKQYSVASLPAGLDAILRRYYHAGRCEALKPGWHRGPLQSVDCNSAYPAAMAQHMHPVGGRWTQGRWVTSNTAFVTFRGVSRGALPRHVRYWRGGEEFTELRYTTDSESREFTATIHEFRLGLATQTIDVETVKSTWDCDQWCSFENFVEPWYAKRLAYRAAGDKVQENVVKFLLNGSYGRFGINPENWYEHYLSTPVSPPPPLHARVTARDPQAAAEQRRAGAWEQHLVGPRCVVWRRPATTAPESWNVAVAASITGAVRAELWRAMCAARAGGGKVVYCDTDSFLATDDGGGVRIGDGLGHWKVESHADAAVIAGPKRYAHLRRADRGAVEWNGDRYDVCKAVVSGARLTPEEMARVLNNELVIYRQPAPVLTVVGQASAYEFPVTFRGLI